MRGAGSEEIDELLDELDVNIKRLRMEYEQFFLGSMKREPQVLRGKVQKIVTKLVNEPPRSSRQKFRFNTLNSRYQVYRQLWGRTMRQIEAGTYKRDQFKAKLHMGAPPEPPAAAEKRGGKAAGSSIDKLHAALTSARKKAGQGGELTKKALNSMVKKQMDAIKAKHGDDVKVKFRVVVENDRAKLKASVSKG